MPVKNHTLSLTQPETFGKFVRKARPNTRFVSVPFPSRPWKPDFLSSAKYHSVDPYLTGF